MEAGRITEAEVLELLECYRVKMTCIDCFASMGVVGGVLSGNTFNNVCLGGLTRDGSAGCQQTGNAAAGSWYDLSDHTTDTVSTV